ncbi:MAG: ankyrin repeat domain-containing protein [Gammaproteobacteria bacterium]
MCWRAAAEGNIEIVQMPFLLDANVQPDERYSNQLTALMWAAGYGKQDVVARLIKKGASIDMQDDRGQTALMMAAAGGFSDTVKTLLSAGADSRIADKSGQTALAVAEAAGKTEVVSILKSAQSNP